MIFLDWIEQSRFGTEPQQARASRSGSHFAKRVDVRSARLMCKVRSRILHIVPSLGLRCGILGLNITNIEKIVIRN